MYAEKTVAYYDSLSKQYFEKWKNDDTLLPLLQKMMLRLPESPAILDIGCGPGVESKRLSDLGAKVTGIDLGDKSLRIARGHAPEVTFRKMNVLEMAFPSGSFDAVLDAAVLFNLFSLKADFSCRCIQQETISEFRQKSSVTRTMNGS